MNKRILALFFGLMIVIVGYIYYTAVVKDTYKLKVNFENASNVFVISETDLAINSNESSKKISSSGDTVRLKKDKYVVIYSGSDGYAGGQKNVDMRNQNQTLDIKPPYSNDKLESLLVSEIATINSAIKSQIPDINQYQILKGQLFNYGEWYGTALIYKGNDYYNADSLRLLMKKEGNNWKLASYPPTIVLSRYNLPDVPVEVIDGVNDIPAPINSRYVN